jgi:hypothetical protein
MRAALGWVDMGRGGAGKSGSFVQIGSGIKVGRQHHRVMQSPRSIVNLNHNEE